MEAQAQGPITRQSTIGDIIQEHPSIVNILLDAGVHCVGCHVAYWETLEDGLKGHGKSEDEINNLVAELNKAALAEAEVGTEDFTITPKALEQVKDNLQEGQILRVGVVPGGCSGMSYSLSLDKEEPQADDKVIEIEGVKVVMDQESFKLLQGAKLDYLDTFEEKGFRFVNPNAKSGCGCGKSFA